MAVQARRTQSIDHRKKHPGKIEIDSIALLLLRDSGIEAADVALLEDGYCLGAAPTLSVNGGELSNTQFSLYDGRIAARFDFDGGYYDTGKVILHETLPDVLQEAIVGKQLNEVVAGGIFDLVDLKVCARHDMTAGTCFRVEGVTEWVPYGPSTES